MRKLAAFLTLAVMFSLLAASPADAHYRWWRYRSPVYYPTYAGAPFYSYYTGDYGYYPGGVLRFSHPYYYGISVGSPVVTVPQPAPVYYAPHYYGSYGYPGYGGVRIGIGGGFSIYWR